MAITVRVDPEKSLLDKCSLGLKFVTGQIDFVNPYVVGGMAFSLTAYFPKGLKMVIFENKSGYSFEYDYTNKTVKAFYFDYNGANDGAAIEFVAADLSAVTGVRFLAIGY